MAPGSRMSPTTAGTHEVKSEHATASMPNEETSDVMRALTEHVDMSVTPFEKSVMVRKRLRLAPRHDF